MDDQLRADAEKLLIRAPGHVVLPAGHGKTHLIAAACAVAQTGEKRVLVLTHTNAGVDVIRRTLHSIVDSRRLIRIATIDSWSKSLTRSFVTLAKVRIPDENSDSFWPTMRLGALNALSNKHVSEMVSQSYDFLLVDEYQDCNEIQHQLIEALASRTTTVRFGDPLQSVFDFDKESAFDWREESIDPTPIEIASKPWRWHPHNEELGEFLNSTRRSIEQQQPIRLEDLPEPVNWHRKNFADDVTTCLKHVHAGESTVILVKRWNQCGTVARRFNGQFSVMEEIQGSVIIKCSTAVDSGGTAAAAGLLALAKSSFAGLPAVLTGKIDVFKTGKIPAFRQSPSKSALDALVAVCENTSPETVKSVVVEIEKFKKPLYRREAWSDLKAGITVWDRGEVPDLTSAVRLIRDRARGRARARSLRLVSTPLRVKGLEFDHCIVMDDGLFTREELYVCLTRPTKSLTVISDEPTIVVD